MKFIAASFFSLQPLMRSSKEKKAKEKRSHYSVIDWAKRIKRQLMENIIKCSYPKMTGQNDRPDESLTGQVHDQAGHCPLTGRYFEPWLRTGKATSGAISSPFELKNVHNLRQTRVYWFWPPSFTLTVVIWATKLTS